MAKGYKFYYPPVLAREQRRREEEGRMLKKAKAENRVRNGENISLQFRSEDSRQPNSQREPCSKEWSYVVLSATTNVPSHQGRESERGCMCVDSRQGEWECGRLEVVHIYARRRLPHEKWRERSWDSVLALDEDRRDG